MDNCGSYVDPALVSSLNNWISIQGDFRGAQEMDLLQGLLEEMTKSIMCPPE